MLPLSGKHDSTIIYTNNTHRTLPKSKFFKHHSLLWPTSIALSCRFIMVFGTAMTDDLNESLSTKSRVWSIGRQKWIKGPMMPYPIECGCGASLNRTHVVIFTLPLLPPTKSSSDNNTCIGKLTLDANLLKWINVDPCFIPLDAMVNKFHNTIQSSTFFDKSGKMYQTEFTSTFIQS